MDSFLHYLGYGLGLAYFCIVMPYCNYEAVRKVFPKRKFPDPKPTKAPGPAPQRKPRKVDKSVPAKKKRSKHSYPVVSTFKEEHRITNPVEFHP